MDPWEEDYDDEEAMADEAEANGWMDSQQTNQPTVHEAAESSSCSASCATETDIVVTPLPDPPRMGILKGGKLWRGAVNPNNNNNGNNSSASVSGNSSQSGSGGSGGSSCSQNNSTLTSSTTASSVGGTGGGEDGTLSRHGEKSPAVRFIHLNDSQADSSDSGGSASGQTAKGGSGHHSAFQQLFPRARKLLQELPEAEIQRLTTAARANNAPSAVSARAAVTSLLSHSTDTTTASDLKLVKRIILILSGLS